MFSKPISLNHKIIDNITKPNFKIGCIENSTTEWRMDVYRITIWWGASKKIKINLTKHTWNINIPCEAQIFRIRRKK